MSIPLDLNVYLCSHNIDYGIFRQIRTGFGADPGSSHMLKSDVDTAHSAMAPTHQYGSIATQR